MRLNVVRGDQPCPQKWKAFLADKKNKTQLLSLLLQLWQDPGYAQALKNKSFYVAVACESFRLSSDDGVSVTCQCVEDLFCTHEEADTQVLLHAKHATNTGAPSVVIRSPDTDVAVFCCRVQNRLHTPLYFRTGTQT